MQKDNTYIAKRIPLPKLHIDVLLIMLAGFVLMLKPDIPEYVSLVGFTVAISFFKFPLEAIRPDEDPFVATQIAMLNTVAYLVRAAFATIHVIVLLNTDRSYPDATKVIVIRELLMRVIPWASALELICDVPTMISIARGINYTLLSLIVVTVINCM